MSTYMAYLEDEEREFLAINKEMNAEWAMIESMLDVIDAKQTARYEQAEAKVIAESGDISDLQALYTEADNEAAEQKKGIFATIIGWFKTLWSKISGWFKRVFTKADPNEVVDINKEDVENASIINTIWGKCKGMINDVKTGNYTNAIKSAAPIVFGAAGTVGGLVLINKFGGQKIKKKVSEVQSWCNPVIDNILGWAKNVVDKVQNSSVGKFAASLHEKVSEAFDRIKKFFTDVNAWLHRVTNGLFGKKETSEDLRNKTLSDGSGETVGKKQIDTIYGEARAAASRYLKSLNGSNKPKYNKQNTKWQEILSRLDEARKSGDLKAVRSVKSEVDNFVHENAIDSDEFAALMLESMYDMFGGRIDREFFEFCMSPDILPTEIYYDFYQEEVNDILGFSMESDNNEIYNEEAIMEDTADILDALAVLD